MEMKDVIISITGIQNLGASDSDTIELVTNGKYRHSKGETELFYDESELTGMEGTRTSLTVGESGVVMSREGRLNSQMIFEEGKKHFFLYETPLGSATMGVDTQKISAHFGESGGDMEIDYVVDFDHAVVGRNKFRINIREQNKKDDSRCQT